MKTLLLSPETFRTEGGIPRIMRLYWRALGETSTGDASVTCISLNDGAVDATRLAPYRTGALAAFVGCSRSKAVFLREVLRHARTGSRIVCGHLHLLPTAWLARTLHLASDYYLVAHGIEVWRRYSWLERRALHGARRIFCISSHTRAEMLRHDPTLPVDKLVVVPNTFDPHLFPLVARPENRPRGTSILTVGRLNREDAAKGFDTLIEALAVLRRRIPGATLRIVGGGDDTPRLVGLARDLGVAEAVTFTGSVDDAALRREYEACDVFALPSRKEGFGLVYLEAMAHGKPCLGARAGGTPDVVNEQVGALVQYGDVAGIAGALENLLQRPVDPVAIQRHAATFAFPAFKQRLAAALA